MTAAITFVTTVLFGIWLIAAAVQKLSDPARMVVTSGQLFGHWTQYPLVAGGTSTLPWVELTVGVAACLFPEHRFVHVAVCALFAVFFVALVVMALRFDSFDCGCFGREKEERRSVILLRGAAALIVASLVLAARGHNSPTSLLMRLWLQSCAASTALLLATLLHARELRDVRRSEERL